MSGPTLDGLLEDYRLLRLVEARARWVIGRAVERIPLAGEPGRLIAELLEPGLTVETLAQRLNAARARIRDAFDAVISADSISALA